jgi:hypothetical protein
MGITAYNRGSRVNLPGLQVDLTTEVRGNVVSYDGSAWTNTTKAYYETRDYDTWAAAIASIGATKATLVISENIAVAATVTVPANVILEWSNGAELQIATGVTLTISSDTSRYPLRKVFDCTGTGKVVFGAGAAGETRPEWWATNTTPGTTDMAGAINAAILSISTVGGTVSFSPTTYSIASGITLYGNILYHGHSSGIIWGDSTANRGTTIKWGGGTSGSMITANNTFGVIWDGINLRGNLTAEPTTTVIGIDVNDLGSGGSSQRNYFRNFSIIDCDYGFAFDKAYASNPNTDGWVIENYWIYQCNIGIYTNSQNVAYSSIRNGGMGCYNVDIYLDRCGFIKIASVSFGGLTPGAIAAHIYLSYISGSVVIEQCQSEGVAGWNFIDFEGGVNKGYPTTLINNIANEPILISNGQDCLISIGNTYFEDITINGNDCHIFSMGDVFDTASFVDNGVNNKIMKLDALTSSAAIPGTITSIGASTAPSYKVLGTTGGVTKMCAEAYCEITGASAVITLNIPSGARLLGAQLRVDFGLVAGENWDAAYSGGCTTAIATNQDDALNTRVSTMYNTNGASDITNNTTNITITKNGGGSFSTWGAIRSIVYYEVFTAMASL